MKNKEKLLMFGIFLFFFSFFCFYDVKAVNIYDGYSCVNGILKKNSDGTLYGECVMIEGTNRFETCPTQSLLNKYSLNSIYSSISFEFDSARDNYHLVIGNLKGLYVRIGYNSSIVPTTSNMYPDASGNLRVTDLDLNTQVKIYVYLDGSNPHCVNTSLGTITKYVPSYRSNVLYNDTLCVQYRSKFANNASMAQSFVPECYAKDLELQYNRESVKKKVDEATSILTNLASSFNSDATIDLKCDFYAQNNYGSSKTKTYVYTVDEYWNVVCFESLIVKFDTPKALFAGDSFEYWVDLEVTKTCYPKHNGTIPDDPGDDDVECNDDDGGENPDNPSGSSPKPSGDVDVGKYYPSSCRFETECIVASSSSPTGQIYAAHAGPNDSFDSCVKSCDGGEYTQSCINKCYTQIYGNSSSKSSSKKMYSGSLASARQLLGATKTAENQASSSNIPFGTLEFNGTTYYVTDVSSTGWDGLDCDESKTIPAGCYLFNGVKSIPLDPSQCPFDQSYPNTVYQGKNPGWFYETKFCKGANSSKDIQINSGCNGNTECHEMLQNPSCLEGSGLLNGGNSSGAVNAGSGSTGSGVIGGVFGSSINTGINGSGSKKNCDDKNCAECSKRGERIMKVLEDSLADIYERLDNGEFVNYDSSKTKFEGKIIDSLTGKETHYTSSNGNPLISDKDSFAFDPSIFVDDKNSPTYTVDKKNNITVTYEWECEKCMDCPPEDDDDDDGGSGGGGGSSGGGSSGCYGPGCGGGGGCSGPGCASDYADEVPATQMKNKSSVKRTASECTPECECYDDPDEESISRTFEIRKYSTVTSYEIKLGEAYKSALDGTTIYGDEIFDKLPSDVKPQYYYVGNEYFSNLFSPIINDWRKWPTYGPNQIKPNCLNDKSCINSRDPSIKHNIIEYFVVGSWGQWKVNILCFYGIINNYCPPTEENPPGCTPTDKDGGLQYMFRPIDLDNNNMFPERAPRWNWTGTISTDKNTGFTSVTGAAKNDYYYKVDPQKLINSIQKKGSSIYSSSNADIGKDNNPELDYEIVLSKNNIRTIKNDINYNKWITCKDGNCVKDKFDMDCTKSGNRIICTSKFLRNSKYLQLVKKPSQDGCNNLYGGKCADN